MELWPVTGARVLQFVVEIMLMTVSCAFFTAKTESRKFSFRRLMLTFLFLMAFSLPGFILKAITAVEPFLYLISLLLYFSLVCRRRGFELFKSTLLLFFISMTADLLLSVIFLNVPFLSGLLQDADDKYGKPIFLFTTVMGSLLAMGFTLLYCRFRTPSGRRQIGETIFRFIRPTVIILSSILLLGLILSRTDYSLSLREQIRSCMPEEILIAVFIVVSVSYMTQDIRYLSQRRLNDSLTQQQKIQDALLHETRVFRHDIANLLYGFQGILLSSDRSAVQAYYDNMVSTCTMINNENVVALRRLPGLSLRTLLMSKIQDANARSIPLYVYVDEELRESRVQEARICEMVGILLDNAIEAAGRSGAPFVSFEAHNAGDDLELVVRNTVGALSGYSLFPDTASSKDGHQGIGLTRLREITDHEKGLLFNLYRRGRYVEASLLMT